MRRRSGVEVMKRVMIDTIIMIRFMPRFLQDGELRLRPVRFWDGLFLSKIRSGTILPDRQELPAFGSWLSNWWWLKKTFSFSYRIELGVERIGFVGIYDLTSAETVEMALVIFDERHRRFGYGSRVFRIVAQAVKKHRIADRILVRIESGNRGSTAFWQRNGLREVSYSGGIRVMTIKLSGLG
jgi:RimJ/RimL family protein N-acetyltransferase